MTRRTQHTMFGPPVVTYPIGPRKRQLQLPGLDGLAVRQLDAVALSEWLEARRAAELDELPELECPTDSNLED